MRGSYRKTCGPHCSQPPHLGEEAKAGRDLPRTAGQPGPGTRPPHQLMSTAGPPPALPGALTDPPLALDASVLTRAAQRGVRLARAAPLRPPSSVSGRRARGPSRPAHPSDPISGRGPGMHLGLARHGPQPKPGSRESSPDEKGRINCPPVSVIPAVGCLLESSLEQKEASAQGPSCPWHPQIPRGDRPKYPCGTEVGLLLTRALL